MGIPTPKNVSRDTDSQVVHANPLAKAGRWLRADDLMRHATKLGAGTAASLAITLVAMPILTRIYGPEAFGLYGVFSALLTLAALVSTGRYEQAIALPAAEHDAVTLVCLCQRLVFGASCLACLTLPFRHIVADLLGEPAIAQWWWALPPAMWLAGQIQVTTAWAARTANYGRVAGARLALTIATVALQFGLMALGEFALLAALLAGLLAQYFWLRRVEGAVEIGSWSEMSLRATEYRRFPLYILPASLIDTLTFQLPLLLGGTWFGIGFAGMYSLATRIVGLPSTLVGNAFAQVFYQEFSRRNQSENGARDFLFRTWLRLAAIGAIPMLLVAYFGESIFLHVLGVEWVEAATIAVILTPMFFAMFISSPTSGALLVLRGEHLSPAFSLSFLSYRIAGFWLGARLDNAALGLGMIAMAEIATILIYNFLILRRLRPKLA